MLERLSSSALPLRGGFSAFQTISSFAASPVFSPPPSRCGYRGRAFQHPPAATLLVGAHTGAAPAPAALPALQTRSVAPGPTTCCVLDVIIVAFVDTGEVGGQLSRSRLLLRPSPAASASARRTQGRDWGASGPRCWDRAGGITACHVRDLLVLLLKSKLVRSSAACKDDGFPAAGVPKTINGRLDPVFLRGFLCPLCPCCSLWI